MCFSRANPFRLIITVDREHPTAEGELFWDDGVGIGRYMLNFPLEQRLQITRVFVTQTRLKMEITIWQNFRTTIQRTR